MPLLSVSKWGAHVVNHSNDGLKENRASKISIDFGAQRLSATPQVFLNVRGDNYKDTFATSTRRITQPGFAINIQRVHEDKGWGQNMQVDCLAVS